jgi:hypothetical protein
MALCAPKSFLTKVRRTCSSLASAVTSLPSTSACMANRVRRHTANRMRRHMANRIRRHVANRTSSRHTANRISREEMSHIACTGGRHIEFRDYQQGFENARHMAPHAYMSYQLRGDEPYGGPTRWSMTLPSKVNFSHF